MVFDTHQQNHQALRSIVAERSRRFVVWVGAGMSVDAGMPTWDQLKEHLLRAADDRRRSLSDRAEVHRAKVEADAVKAQRDSWIAFQRLRHLLGETRYREAIRRAFAAADRSPIPEGYKLLWQLRPAGLVNFNLDRLATRAYTHIKPGSAPLEFTGKQIHGMPDALRGSKQFIANLHGVAEDATSWVLTDQDVRHVARSEAYETTLTVLFLTSTVIFVGISAEDVQINRYLQKIGQLDIPPGPHYWITHRSDTRTDGWADSAGILRIRYDLVDGKHDNLLTALRDLVDYVPQEADAPPVLTGGAGDLPVLPPPRVLAQQDASAIREQLNKYASRLLANPSPQAYEAYRQFSVEYDEAIHRSWYIPVDPKGTRLLDFTLEHERARGAFGRVFCAHDDYGDRVALKLLHDEVRNRQDWLQSFRRGVRSMKILQDHSVDGMVAVRAASEIPAFVAMEWIEGPSLTEAVQAGELRDWPSVLSTAEQLTRIIESAHALPERVLHRDIRPGNVMLRNYWTTKPDVEVVVMDFDLSWHKDAPEQSVIHATATGFLAPEQLRSVRGTSSRSALVDSFGLGMTFYFICSGRNPVADQHLHADWEAQVVSAVSEVRDATWLSLPARMSRLILAGTQNVQSERWDVAQMALELSRLREALLTPERVTSLELLTEEVAARTDAFQGYCWDSDVLSAQRTLPTGLQITIRALENTGLMELSVEWVSGGQREYSNVGKFVERGQRTATQRLARGGWSIEQERRDGDSMHLLATVRGRPLAGRPSDLAEGIDSALEFLRFES